MPELKFRPTYTEGKGQIAGDAPVIPPATIRAETARDEGRRTKDKG
jgi:hypothetical protein